MFRQLSFRGGSFFTMKISLFKGLPEKGRPHMSDETLTIDDFINAVKYGKWKHIIEPIRTEKEKSKRDQLKKNLPAVTISGLFAERKEELIVEHSGFLCVDIDYFNDKTALLQDPYTYCLMSSTSGTGLAAIVKINPDKHKESYNWLSAYYFACYGIAVDPAPKNPASLRYVSYDPEIYVNVRSLKSKTKVEKPRKIHTLPYVFGSSDVDTMVQQVVSSGKNIASSYDDWLKIGFSIASGFGEVGRNYYHAISRASEKYNSQQCDKQYDRCLKGNKSGITVGTFYHYLKEAGVDISTKKYEKEVQLVAMAKKSGRTQEGAAMQLEQMQHLDPATAKKIVDEVYDRNDIDLSKVANDPDQLIQSLIQWININYPMKRNVITGKIEESGSELSEQRTNTIYLQARIAFNSKEVNKQLIESIINSEMVFDFNPITDFIDKNRHRNTTGNVDKLVKCIRTVTPNYETFLKKWLVSIVAAYDGNPVRSVLALTGGQNSGKTEFFRRLLPGELSKYYAESKLDSGKDDELLMCQKLIVMDDEMGGKSKQDSKRFKELTSKATFSLRAAYGRHNMDYKRLAILCGTSNDPNVINDPTGNTRILPIEILSIDHEMYNSIDKSELFMELVRMYEVGYDWQLSKDEMIDLSIVSSEFEQTPYEKELIIQIFKNPNEGGYVEFLSSTEIKQAIEGTLIGQKIMNFQRFNIELSKIFGKSEIKRVNGQSKRCYAVTRVLQTKHADNEEVPF